MNKKLLILCTLLIGVTLLISGCTSKTPKDTPKEDIKPPASTAAVTETASSGNGVKATQSLQNTSQIQDLQKELNSLSNEASSLQDNTTFGDELT